MRINKLWWSEATFVNALDNKQELFRALGPIFVGKDLLLYPSICVQDAESRLIGILEAVILRQSQPLSE